MCEGSIYCIIFAKKVKVIWYGQTQGGFNWRTTNSFVARVMLVNCITQLGWEKMQPVTASNRY